jgi:hypothetical protein
MSYLLNKTTGQLLINLVDGTADGPDINPGQNVSDIDLFGKNYPLYGQWLDENFIKLLQNFANATAPAKPLQGELWYNTSTGFLNVYTGTSWKLVSPVLVSSTAPDPGSFGSVVGTQWWDTVNLQLNSWTGSAWYLVGPGYKAPDGISGPIVEDILDTVGGTHTVTKFYHNANVVAISSLDSTFTISPANPVTGFSTIAPGFTLATGIANEVEFIGSATNSKMLGNVVAANYARTDIIPTFSSNILVGGGNISIDSAPTGSARYYNNVLNANVSIWANVGGTPTSALRVLGTDASTNVLYALNVTGNTSIGGNTVVGGNLTIYGTTTSGITGGGSLVLSFSPALAGVPTTPTVANSFDASGTIASTGFVQNAITYSTTAPWLGSQRTISTNLPNNTQGSVGDFWFQI